MEQLNNKIKDIYNQRQAPLPSKFNWDDMKEGIFEKMDAHEGEAKPFFLSKLGRLRLILVALIFMLVSSGVYFLVKNPNKKQHQNNFKKEVTKPFTNKLNSATLYQNEAKINKEEKNEIDRPEKSVSNVSSKAASNNEKISNLNKPTINLKNDAKNRPLDESTTKPASTEKSILLINNRLTKVAENELTNKNELIGKDKLTNKNGIQQKNNTDLIKKQLANQNEKDKSLSNQQALKNNLNTTKKVDTNIEPLIQKKSLLISDNNNSDIINKYEAVIITNKAFNNDKQPYSSIQLDGGLTNLINIYNKVDSKQYQSEVGFPSYYVNASYSYTFDNGLYLLTGLMWNKLKTKFELTDTITYNFPLKDALTKRVKSVYTGNHIRNVYEDVEVPTRALRQVRHYNHFDALSIPFIVGKRFGIKKLTYHIGIGTDVSLLNRSNGKTLRDNQVITYSTLESGVYHNGIQVAALAESGLGISINQQMTFTMHFRYKRNLRNWSDNGLVVKPQTIMLGTGLRFNF